MKKTNAELRSERAKAKDLLSKGIDNLLQEEYTTIKNQMQNISPVGYLFCKLQMKSQNLDGIPGIDTKTYKKWIENGYKVKKGEKSSLYGITRVDCSKEGDEKILYPKQYHLFHRNQIEKIQDKSDCLPS